MANKMLIDASHPEETRVVVLRGNRVEEFDFEAASKRQLRGNIYLAKVTRVEPSLQAAFVDYGGNRHGFLAFSEIHPDYYQIPVADRQALIEDEARAHAQDDEEEGNRGRRSRRRRERGNGGDRAEKRRNHGDETVSEAATEEGHHDAAPTEFAEVPEGAYPDAPVPELAFEAPAAISESAPEAEAPAFVPSEAPVEIAPAQEVVEPVAEAPAPAVVEFEAAPVHHDHTIGVDEAGYAVIEEHDTPDGDATEDLGNVEDVHARRPARDEEHDDEEEEHVEQVGGDAMEEMPLRPTRGRKQYKIQEVIKRRQVLLVQVVKEERGNKGAALTTYLSLAGRYSVLMPNTARGGGISRKITDALDRKRLKELVQDLEVPEGMGVILRTAGASRTKPEIKRDFEYLLRMWETVRELTLKSTAPALVYEEGSLIKRSIRDLYNKDVEEVLVAGEEGHREAKDFMRLLMPSHAKNVQPWREPQAIFAKFGVEQQLDSMFSNVVTLKSGGYIVINQTEALVAIDVNSGRSTREHNIEDTAVRTNVEAADEVARQLRLRDLAGLIVVDFIDMEEHRNNRTVERRMKEALKNDRARIQIGRISHFGLLEMSRQRIRTGVLEGSTTVCPHCVGAGTVRSIASVALHVLRVLEDTLVRNSAHNVTVRTRTEVALYILNQKRSHLREVEARFGVVVTVEADDTLTGTNYHALERGELASPPVEYKRPEMVRMENVPIADLEEEIEDTEDETETEAEGEDLEANGTDEQADSRRRRRRRRRGRGDRDPSYVDSNAPQPSDMGLAVMAEIAGDIPATLAEATFSDGDSDESEAEAFEIEGEGEEDNRTEVGADGRRRRRSRRGGRNRRRGGERGIAPLNEAFATSPSDDFAPEGEGPAAPVPVDAPDFALPLAHYEHPHEVPVEAIAHPAVVEPAPAPYVPPAPEPAPAPVMVAQPVVVAEPEAPKAPEPPPAYTQPLPEASSDPARPKRTGWWARAKQTFGGS